MEAKLERYINWGVVVADATEASRVNHTSLREELKGWARTMLEAWQAPEYGMDQAIAQALREEQEDAELRAAFEAEVEAAIADLDYPVPDGMEPDEWILQLRVAREMYAEDRATDPSLPDEAAAREVFDMLKARPDEYLTDELWPMYLAGGFIGESGAKAWNLRLRAARKVANQ